MTELSWKHILGQLSAGVDLKSEQAAWAMNTLMSGTSTDAQIAAFVMGLKVKGETAVEVGGLVEAMLANAVHVQLDSTAVDVVGTGGDGAHTVNISTMSALVVAGTGAPVLKHGNRAISSKSGTADVLEALGVAVSMPADKVATCLADAGIAFCFAPNHHPAMRYAATVRKELGIPTVFNVLGPLANPGQPAAALLGCADARFAPVLAQVQLDRGLKSIVVRSDEGLDELSTSATSQVWDVTSGQMRHEVLNPSALGLQASTAADLRGGEAAENAQVVRDLLQGSRAGRLTIVREVVALNAAAALVAFDAATGAQKFGPVQSKFVDRVASALPVAFASIDTGAAWDVLSNWGSVSTALSA
jgi:anthranilate phosphoribosyltransferase